MKKLYSVTRDYRCAYPEPFTARRGERLAWERRPSPWPGWIWARPERGAAGKTREGWVPEAWVRMEGETCVLLRDYHGRELTVEAGETVMADFEESGWIWGSTGRGEAGWVPLDHLERMDGKSPEE